MINDLYILVMLKFVHYNLIVSHLDEIRKKLQVYFLSFYQNCDGCNL